MSTLLAGRAVLVTGAGRGLGRAFAAALAAAGASVLVNDIDGELAEQVAAELGAAGGDARAHGGTIATWNGAREAVAACVASFGGIDGLVNNAGLFHMGPAWEDDEAAMRELIEVNVLGAMYTGIHAIRAMLDGHGGAIVNITSEAQVGLPQMACYAASKGAMASLTYAWAADLEGRPVRVNGLAPVGLTRMTPRDAEGNPRTRPAPESVAPVVVYLLSDLAAALRGRVLHFNGTTLTPFEAPRKAAEHLTRERWTAEEIAAACAGPLAAPLAR